MLVKIPLNLPSSLSWGPILRSHELGVWVHASLDVYNVTFLQSSCSFPTSLLFEKQVDCVISEVLQLNLRRALQLRGIWLRSPFLDIVSIPWSSQRCIWWGNITRRAVSKIWENEGASTLLEEVLLIWLNEAVVFHFEYKVILTVFKFKLFQPNCIQIFK